MLRLSSYLILSDRLENGGYAALSSLSGAIELISEGLYELLNEIIQKGNPHSLHIKEDSLPPEIRDTFVERGYFTEYSHEEERAYVQRFATVFHEQSTKQPGVVIVPNLDCNYRCVYCFEKPLQAKLKERKTKMDIAGVDAVFQSIDQLVTEVGPVRGGLTLYGGEPLMAENRSVVEYIVKKGREKEQRLAAVTNGHDLDAYIDLLGTEKISFVQITIDGPEELHNKRRIALDGTSSFQRIISNMRRAMAETDVTITVRINMDGDNYKGFSELLSVFDREGWLNNPRIMVSAAIVKQKDQSGAVNPLQDVNVVKAELSGVAGQYANVEIGNEQAINGDIVVNSLAANKPYNLRSCFCSASCGMYIFLPDGTISCCWDSLGEEYSCIGNYSEKGLFVNKDKAAHRFNRSVANMPACLDCKYCLVCAGGCSQYAEHNFNDLYHPYCGDFKETYSWVLAEAVEKYLKARGL